MLMEHAERVDEAMDVIVAGGGPAGLMTRRAAGRGGGPGRVCERGSEPTQQARGTARHPRPLEVLTMIDAGGGRRISDVLLAQRRRVPGRRQPGLELAATRIGRPDSHATHSVTVISAV